MASASFSPQINLNTAAITLTDTSDFVSQGIALIDVNGNFKITAPSGNVIWDSGLNYYFETGTAQSGSTTSLQLASGATSLNIANYYILATGGAGSGQVARIASYNATTKLATFVSPVGVAFNNTTTYRICLADIFLAANLSNQPTISLYSGNTVEQGTYTIDYLVYNSNSGEYYSTQSTVDYQYTLPTVVIQQTVDCLSPLFISVDATDYTLFGGIQPTNITRTHTIIYPPSTGVADVVGGTANLYTSILYNNGTYTTTISTVVSWTLPDGTVINATLTGDQERLVQCEQWICDIYCCMKSVYNEWQGYINTNHTLAQQYFDKWIAVTGLATQIQAAYQCGDSNAVAGYVNTLRTIANCNSNCQCDDNTIALIQGLGNITNTYDLDSGTPAFFYVTPTVSGNTTTWEAGLTTQAISLLTDQPTLQGIDNIRITNPSSNVFTVRGARVEATAGIEITPTQDINSITTIYSVGLKNLLVSNLGDALTTTTSYETLRTYTLLNDVLADNGDILRIKAVFEVTPNNDAKQVRIQFAGNTLFQAYNANIATVQYLQMDIDCVRLSATTIGVMPSFKRLNPIGGIVDEGGIPVYSAPYVVNNLNDDNLTNVITFQGDSTVAGDINCVLNQIEIVKS